MPKFIKSASTPNDWLNDQVTEICLTGRSNVGKSSIINVLAKQKIALSSKTPGRTQLVNFYDFGDYRLVDLPGYGYMVGDNKLKNKVANIIDAYLVKRTNLYGILQVCDANVITEMDRLMSLYFQKRFKNHYILLNKVDKANISKYKQQLANISKFLHKDINNILLISAKNKINIDKLHSLINQIITK